MAPPRGTFPQTKPSYGSYQWLQLKLGLMLGSELKTSPNYETWDTYQLDIIDHIIQSGVNEFYFPILAPGQKRPYAWSFLKKAATEAQVIGQVAYDLPSDFGGWVGGFTHAAANAVRRLTVVWEDDLRASLAMEDTDAEAEQVAIRPKTAASTSAQAFEFVLHPTPSSTAVLHYRYTATPATLDETNKFPQGVQGHAETIAAACMAKAECLFRQPGPMQQMFQQRLQASVLLDMSFAGDSPDDDIMSWSSRATAEG